MPAAPVIAYLCTTFPNPTEMFIQREVSSLRALGVNLRVYSLWGGGGEFAGMRITTFPKWKLMALLWLIPLTALRRPRLFGEMLGGLLKRRSPSWLNFWENMLGAGFAAIHAGHFRRETTALLHAAWGGAPATAAWLLRRFDGHSYGMACHAYDVYQDGGDWWLQEKIIEAAFVHTSTGMARRTLIERGGPPGKIHAILSGLLHFPVFKPLRTPRAPMRLLCVARLVPKKGLDRQLRIYAALKAAGVSYEARIAGEGPLRGELEALAKGLGLQNEVTFTGHRPAAEIAEQLAWADVMLHTGVIADDGDRDGLPNVIPEAMAAGVQVVTSPVAATTEAIVDGITGRVAEVNLPAVWVEILMSLREDDAQAERLRTAARKWVEENFDAHKNSARLAALFDEVKKA